MNFSYSSKKWLVITLASMLITTASVSAAETTPQATTMSQAQSDNKLTLAKAIEQALATNSSLQSLRIDAKNADINARLVRDTAGEISSSFIESLGQAQQKYVTEARATMTKTLNALAVKSAESKTKLGAQKMYYDLLHAQSDVELKKQSLARAQTQLKVAKAQFEVGTKAKTDILQAEMGVAGAQATLVAAENSVEVTRMKFNEFLGVELLKQWELSDVNKALSPNSMTLEQATDLSQKQRIEIVQKQEQLKLKEVERDLIAEYSAASTYQGKISRNDVEKATMAIKDEKRSVFLNVAESYYNLNAAKLTVEFKLKAKDAAAESYRLTNLRFENGLATTLEVIQAEEELADRENQYQESLRNYNLAVVSFDTSLGN